MLKESLIKEDESFGGLYYSFLIIFIIAFSSIFAVFTASLNANQVNDKAWYVLLSFSVGPLAIIVATLLFAWLRGDSLVKICGWEKCSSKYYLIAVIAFISVFFGLANLNTSFIDFLSKKFGYTASSMTLPTFSIINYILVIFAVCILPAVAEEVAMRGIVLRGVKSGNVIVNAVLGGLLFSLFHMSPMQTAYQFAVGFVFSLIAIRSGSTVPTTIVHFLNNFAIVTIEYFSPKLFANLGGWMFAITIPATICLVLITVLLIADGDNKTEGSKQSLKNFFMYSIAGIFICTFMWTMSFLG
ncbi:MAG: CPBP family intramembrane metalloprotease [Clostridia bacterium]|nr:CPBP family intramembrane metalloprotease [Clostridia bacterium]